MSYEEILTQLLDCGEADLKLLRDCNYDFCDILEAMYGFMGDDERIHFNNILLGVISLYKQNIQEAIDNTLIEIDFRIKELQADDEAQELKDLWNEKEALEGLNVFDDIEYFLNYLDTSIYITDDTKKETYKKYLSDTIDTENNNIGFVYLDLEG